MSLSQPDFSREAALKADSRLELLLLGVDKGSRQKGASQVFLTLTVYLPSAGSNATFGE